MRIEFYGVRGSMPAAGKSFVKYGGNTACVHVLLNDGTDIVLDSGTGIVGLGQQLMEKTSPVYLLLTHNHWDHIQGFPFFLPAHQSDREVIITPGQTEPRQDTAILEQMSGTLFPVHYSQLQANVKIENQARKHTWQLGEANISRQKLNHPSSGSAYCIQTQNCKLAYVTDNELDPPYQVSTTYEQWLEFIGDADVLIHDAQYSREDMPDKHGWGHSMVEQAIQLAIDANVKTCVLYSHDTARNDHAIDQQVLEMQQLVEQKNASVNIYAAYEGLVLKF